MLCHENRLLVDDSREISYLIFFRKLGKISQNVAAVVIGALRFRKVLDLTSIFLYGYLISLKGDISKFFIFHCKFLLYVGFYVLIKNSDHFLQCSVIKWV